MNWFSQALRLWMERESLNQLQASRRLGVTPSQLNRYLRGQLPRTADRLTHLMEAIGMDIRLAIPGASDAVSSTASSPARSTRRLAEFSHDGLRQHAELPASTDELLSTVFERSPFWPLGTGAPSFVPVDDDAMLPAWPENSFAVAREVQRSTGCIPDGTPCILVPWQGDAVFRFLHIVCITRHHKLVMGLAGNQKYPARIWPIEEVTVTHVVVGSIIPYGSGARSPRGLLDLPEPKPD